MIYYDKFHIALRLTRNNIIYLRLYHEYEISNLVNRKLHYQKIDLFKIFEKTKSLVYYLKFSLIIKIYFIISMILLKFISKNDLYKRVRNINLFFIKKKKKKNVDLDFVFKYKFYEIKKLLKRYNIKKNIIYLIK